MLPAAAQRVGYGLRGSVSVCVAPETPSSWVLTSVPDRIWAFVGMSKKTGKNNFSVLQIQTKKKHFDFARTKPPKF